jgi:type I restriction enzyme M protein
MRILVHYHAYGDAEKVPALVAQHSQRIRAQISQREQEEVERLEAEYQGHAERLAQIDAALAAPQIELFQQSTSAGKKEAEATLKKLESQRARPAAKIAERDERIAEARRRAEGDRQEVIKVGEELIALYDNPDELLKHARVVSLDEIAENEFNLNIPRYVDTFEPEPRLEVKEALEALEVGMLAVQQAETNLRQLLKGIGCAH